DRPAAYEDVGILSRWGSVIHELKNHEAEMDLLLPRHEAWQGHSIDQFVTERSGARAQHAAEMHNVSALDSRPQPVRRAPRRVAAKSPKAVSLLDEPEARPIVAPAPKKKRAGLSRRRSDAGKHVPPRTSPYLDRRGTSLLPPQK